MLFDFTCYVFYLPLLIDMGVFRGGGKGTAPPPPQDYFIPKIFKRDTKNEKEREFLKKCSPQLYISVICGGGQKVILLPPPPA